MSASIPLSVVLTIAGSDSGGGAGIQADLKTFQAFATFGTSAVTAITCQNTTGVSAVQGIEPDIVAGQIRDVLGDFPVGAAKTGMLFSPEIIRAVRATWQEHAGDIPLVADPVMVAATGARLLQREAEEELAIFLKDCATLITPNLPEAEVLLGRSIGTLSEMRTAVVELRDQYAAAVLLKGGHRRVEADERAEEAVDVFVELDRDVVTEFALPVIDSRNTHGTGCTLSAAVAAGFALGRSPKEAVSDAKEFLHGAIRNAPNLGAGKGPVNHLWRAR